MTICRADPRPGARVLRSRSGRARLPRGRRAPWLRAFRRRRGARTASLTALCHTRREPRPVRRGLRGVRGHRGALAGADDHRRGAGGRRALARRAPSGCRPRARTGRDSPSTRSPMRRRPGGSGAAAGYAGRPRAPRPGVRRGARARAGDRPAAPRPGRVPLAHGDTDRGRPLVALGRGRRRPLQGGGLGVDAARSSARRRSGPTRTRAGAATRTRGLATCAGCCSRRRPS